MACSDKNEGTSERVSPNPSGQAERAKEQALNLQAKEVENQGHGAG